MARGAGSLDRRISIERSIKSQDDSGAEVDTWSTFLERWASRTDVSDEERYESAETGAAVMARFKVRSDEATREITAKDRIQQGGLTWDITGIKNATVGRDRYIYISATARNDD